MSTRPKDQADTDSIADIRILGPLLLRLGSETVTPRARKPRQLLALLLLNIDRFVPVSYLRHGLWDDTPPNSAITTLQTYILQLRHSLGDTHGIDARDVLVTMDGGYMFSVPDARFDLHVYQRLVSEGITALRSGRDHEAKHLLEAALDLWQGDALADVRHGHVLENEATRLEESRLRVLEHRIDADLRLGRDWEVLEELSTLSMRHPLHENLHMQYMLALHRSGHRLDALRVFQRLRSALVQEVGMEPTTRLCQLQQSILTSDLCAVDAIEDVALTAPSGDSPIVRRGS